MSIETIGTPSVTIDSERWPAVAEVPAGPVAAMSAAIADRLLRRAVARLPLRLVYPDGTAIGAGDATSATLTVHRPQALARRIGRHGLIGFGESYLAGDWSSEDLTRVLTVLAESVADLVPGPLQWLRPLAPAFEPTRRGPSRDQARRNVAEHYDLSNDLFAEFLDETMTYSSALFDDLPASWPDLAAAQRRKIDRLLDLAGVGPGSRVLEIGTGWASCASERPPAGRGCGRSRYRWSSSGWRVSGSPPRACPTGCRSTCATTATPGRGMTLMTRYSRSR
ncbi:mycolic acid cyclopropane synthetase family protein [Mycobacterium kansasii]|uniref:Mycolic acid cyclopropane synthetase family protein n=1 Tax=Mycobacterium kansasii TaxID=1768 RepID=A0A1V3WRP8_MYCKA|nr:mycolic acid cyclopropane synthetase family protein [Mycobacterium kansasii]